MTDFESLCGLDLSLEEQQQAARERMAEDFRPVAVAVNVLPDQSAPRATLIWRRPSGPVLAWDPVQRTMFIEYFPKWSGKWRSSWTCCERATTLPLRSGHQVWQSAVSKRLADDTKKA